MVVNFSLRLKCFHSGCCPSINDEHSDHSVCVGEDGARLQPVKDMEMRTAATADIENDLTSLVKQRTQAVKN